MRLKLLSVMVVSFVAATALLAALGSIHWSASIVAFVAMIGSYVAVALSLADSRRVDATTGDDGHPRSHSSLGD